MDALITAGARALALGDPLRALNHVALRNDPPALALRGIAMAQLEQPARARELLRAAARAFGEREPRARARCIVADAEVALASRDLGFATRSLQSAADALARGRPRERAARASDPRASWAPARTHRRGRGAARRAGSRRRTAAPRGRRRARACGNRVALGSHAPRARAALACAAGAAHRSRVPALIHEVEQALALLERPAAREVRDGEERPLRIDEVEELLRSRGVVLDGCARSLRRGTRVVALARRPVLFALARALCACWPEPVDRDVLIELAFDARRIDDSHRARLRVELSRLRALCRGIARIDATATGFVLRPIRAASVRVLLPPIDGEDGALLALLADGQAWSSSALALALGESQRNVQRALAALLEQGRVRALGAARARRWLSPPLPGIATTLLLTTALAVE